MQAHKELCLKTERIVRIVKIFDVVVVQAICLALTTAQAENIAIAPAT